MKQMRTIFLVLFSMLFAGVGHALVNFESGQLEINGVLLLQDAKQPNRYYYLPQAPSIALSNENEPEIYAVKFVDPNGQNSGGLFHAMVSLTLPEEERLLLQAGLKEKIPDAEVIGPVPLYEGEGSGFSIVSGVLTDQSMTQSIISSGHAPVTPGSRAAIAASLSPQGATLLWDSFSSPTSDVSLSVAAYYEAVLPSFEARIQADISTVYTHYSKLKNDQGGFKRTQIRDVADSLIRSGDIQIDVLNRLPENSADAAMQALVDLIANKLTEAIFDHKTGFTALPEKEEAVEKGQVKGRQTQGWLTKLFKGSGNKRYVSDDQFVLKRREDIQQAHFRINLNRRAVIRVPFYASGNLGGLFSTPERREKLLKVIDLADPAFQKRDIFFQIDSAFTSAFEESVNFVSVALRKRYPDGQTATGEVLFTREDIRQGALNKSWRYARLGIKASSWMEYEYRLEWSIGKQTPTKVASEWQTSRAPILSLAPPLKRTDLEIDADRFLFDEYGVRTAKLEIRYMLLGEAKVMSLPAFRATDADSVEHKVLFHDENEPISWRVSWYDQSGTASKGEWRDLDGSFLLLVPPKL